MHDCRHVHKPSKPSLAKPPHPLCDLLTLRVSGITAGYGDEVIFADGSFIDGSPSELGADGPVRPPYVVYCQVRVWGRARW